MKFSLRHWALAALLATTFLPAAAMAQTGINSAYASISGLYVVPIDSDYSEKVAGFTVGTDLKMDAGFGLLFAFGYGADVGLRGEVELGYRKVDFDKFDGLNIKGNGIDESFDGELSVEGDVNTLSLMVNGIYAFDAGRLRPYFGVGIGLARHDGTFDKQTIELEIDVEEYEFESSKSSEDDMVLAYQGMAGVAYPMSEVAEVRLGYRYFATADADFDGVDVSYGTHNIEAGVMFRF